jgi:hypothetical protein
MLVKKHMLMYEFVHRYNILYDLVVYAVQMLYRQLKIIFSNTFYATTSPYLGSLTGRHRDHQAHPCALRG